MKNARKLILANLVFGFAIVATSTAQEIKPQADPFSNLTVEEKLDTAAELIKAAQTQLKAETAGPKLSASNPATGLSFRQWREEMEFVKGMSKAVDKYSMAGEWTKFRFKWKLQTDRKFRERVMAEFKLGMKAAAPLVGSTLSFDGVDWQGWAEFWKDFPWEEWTEAMKEIIPVIMDIIKLFIHHQPGSFEVIRGLCDKIQIWKNRHGFDGGAIRMPPDYSIPV